MAEEKREQDNRNSFVPADPSATTFTAMAADPADTVDNSTTSRWAGVLGGAAYRVEVPANWNGKLVMYAHGYAGTGNALGVNNPSIRRYLIQNGYAWAASSYSKNYYDVRVGVEDTNALALEFNKIAAAAGRTLAAPSKIFITGHSMGGHITAAAIEDEAYATANHKVKYNGAVPMCGVVGDTELFDYFAAAQVTAQALAGVPKYPFINWSDISAQVTRRAVHQHGHAARPDADRRQVRHGDPEPHRRPAADIRPRPRLRRLVPGRVGRVRRRRHDHRHPEQERDRHQPLHLHRRRRCGDRRTRSTPRCSSSRPWPMPTGCAPTACAGFPRPTASSRFRS